MLLTSTGPSQRAGMELILILKLGHYPVGWRLDPVQVRRYLTLMKTIVSSKGQIVLPAELRQRDRIVQGQRFEIERLEVGRYLLKKQTVPSNEGLVDWLLSCPVKGWFEPIPSESTETL